MTTTNIDKHQIGLLIDDETFEKLTKLRSTLSVGNILSVSATIRQLINSAGNTKSSIVAKKKAKNATKKRSS